MVPEVAVAIEKAAAEPEFSADSTVEREVASVPAEAAVEAQLCFIDKVVEVDGCCSRCGSSNEPTTFAVASVAFGRQAAWRLGAFVDELWTSCLVACLKEVISVVRQLEHTVHLVTCGWLCCWVCGSSSRAEVLSD